MVFNLKWLLIFASSLIALLVCGLHGLLGSLWEVDNTRISYVIIALYLAVSSFVGWLTSRAPRTVVTDYRHACHYVPELMTGLGMLGTVIGFLQMLGAAFGGIDLSNMHATQAALSGIAKGVGVALTTTLVGLACAMLLHLQLVNLGIARRRQ
jgi:hypothetical protein